DGYICQRCQIRLRLRRRVMEQIVKHRNHGICAGETFRARIRWNGWRSLSTGIEEQVVHLRRCCRTWIGITDDVQRQKGRQSINSRHVLWAVLHSGCGVTHLLDGWEEQPNRVL